MNDAEMDSLLGHFAQAYAEWVSRQLAAYGPQDQYTDNAIRLALLTSLSAVAVSMASAVWSAQEARKLDKAHKN